jgi:hypothetical protein
MKSFEEFKADVERQFQNCSHPGWVRTNAARPADGGSPMHKCVVCGFSKPINLSYADALAEGYEHLIRRRPG